MKINELIVVEGKNDEAKIKKLFDCDVICTNGLALSKETMEIIKQASEKQGIIIMTDPDYPGKKIRDEICEEVKNAKHVFVEKKKAIGKRNVGIEYMEDNDIIEALENVITFKENKETISLSQYISLGLMQNKNKRDYFCEKLKLGRCNNKRLLKYLNMLDVDYQQLEEINKEYGR